MLIIGIWKNILSTVYFYSEFINKPYRLILQITNEPYGDVWLKWWGPTHTHKHTLFPALPLQDTWQWGLWISVILLSITTFPICPLQEPSLVYSHLHAPRHGDLHSDQHSLLRCHGRWYNTRQWSCRCGECVDEDYYWVSMSLIEIARMPARSYTLNCILVKPYLDSRGESMLDSQYSVTMETEHIWLSCDRRGVSSYMLLFYFYHKNSSNGNGVGLNLLAAVI